MGGLPRLGVLAAGAAALGACATSPSLQPGADKVIGGPSGDLRVLLNDSCVPDDGAAPPVKGPGGALAIFGVTEQTLAGLGGLAMQSFAAYLQAAGAADVTRSAGSNGGAFYAPAGAAGVLSVAPEMRCLVLVRNGFGGHAEPYAGDAPPDLREAWRALGLTRTPDLYAVLRIETAGEAERARVKKEDAVTDLLAQFATPAGRSGAGEDPPFFRLAPDRIYIHAFQNPRSASGERDVGVVVNMALAEPQGGARPEAEAAASMQAGRFAVGGLRLPGLREGDFGRSVLVGLQTNWMPMPAARSNDRHATVDITVYVTESSPGNEMLEQIGEYLATGAAPGGGRPRSAD